MAMLLMLGLVLAACGGGGDGGGDGGDSFTLRAAVINETTGPIDVTVDVAGEPGEAQSLESCTADVLEFQFPAFEDWVLTVNGQPAIDSTTLEDNLFDRNLIAKVWAEEDGSVRLEELSAGRGIGAPAQAGICL